MRGLAEAVAVAALVVTGCSDTTGTSPSAPTGTGPSAASSPSTSTAAAASTAPGPTVAGATTSAAPTATTPPPAPLGDPVVQLAQVSSPNSPVDAVARPGDTTTYVVQQTGQVIAQRADSAGTVLDVSDLIVSGGEQGLLGLAFHPAEPLAYVDYTNRSGDTVIAEYAVGADGTFDASSARILLTIDQPYPNHNGGEVVFGPDGMLYIGMGDGGAGGDPERRALNLQSLLGKILRIDVRPSADAPYTIPADNPFVGVDGARPELWAIGLRNPWRFHFDRATGDLWIADVGQNKWEEVDVGWAADGGGRGLNFGWSAWEGNARFNEDQSPDGATAPVFVYEHGDAGCSISGGVRYRGAAIPALVGWYVYGDYCGGKVRALKIEGQAVTKDIVLGEAPSISAVTEAPDGELLVLSVGGALFEVMPP